MPHFAAYNVRRLRGLGLRGAQVEIGFEAGRLTLTGESGPPLAWPPSVIARVRIGSEETKYGRLHQTMLWRRDDPQRVTISPLRDQGRGYAETIRPLAAAVAASGGRIERGVGLIGALVPSILFGLLLAAALAVSVFVLGGEPWWGRLIPPVAPGVLFAIMLWVFVRRTRPRAVRALAEIERELPQGLGPVRPVA